MDYETKRAIPVVKTMKCKERFHVSRTLGQLCVGVGLGVSIHFIHYFGQLSTSLKNSLFVSVA